MFGEDVFGGLFDDDDDTTKKPTVAPVVPAVVEAASTLDTAAVAAVAEPEKTVTKPTVPEVALEAANPEINEVDGAVVVPLKSMYFEYSYRFSKAKPFQYMVKN